MGKYINPQEGTKEEWLTEYGLEMTKEEVLSFTDFEGPSLPVCLVNDPARFSAAGVLYERREVEAFTLSHDVREKRFFLVLRKDLEDVGAI